MSTNQKVRKKNKSNQSQIVKIVKIGLQVLLLLFLLWPIFNIIRKQPLPYYGIGLYFVSSGSMEPTIKTGSLIFIKEAPADNLEVGDVITIAIKSGGIVTHRLVAIEEKDGETQYTTRGDGNEANDDPITYSQIKGKVFFWIAGVGAWVERLQGGVLIIWTVAVALIGICLKLAFSRKDKSAPDSEDKPPEKSIVEVCPRCNEEMEIKIIAAEKFAICRACRIKRKIVRQVKPSEIESEQTMQSGKPVRRKRKIK